MKDNKLDNRIEFSKSIYQLLNTIIENYNMIYSREQHKLSLRKEKTLDKISKKRLNSDYNTYILETKLSDLNLELINSTPEITDSVIY